MRFGSLFTGVGGFDLAFERAGMECAFQIEIDPHCQVVLEKHWTDIHRYSDIVQVTRLEPVDVLVGGFPCQDLSVAGQRKGLDGSRSGLFYEFMRLVAEGQPRWVVVENVPGLLSSAGGRDMGAVLGTLAKLGYGYAYRVLDAQYFGVPQRRRRVFIVGHSRGRCPSEVLFEPDSVCGGAAPKREAREGVAGTLAASSGRSRGANSGDGMTLMASTLTASASHQGTRGAVSDNLVVAWAATGAGYWRDGIGPLAASTAAGPNQVVSVALRGRDGGATAELGGSQAHALRSSQGGGDKAHILLSSGVRRLTPKECERLQGFPDDWTAGHADSHRYRMLGNAVAVPVTEWIARRIVASDAEAPCRQ